MQDIKKARIEVALLFLLFIFILPTRNMVYDFEFWTNWALKIHRDGLTRVYDDPTVNYHPLFLYILYLYDLVQGNEHFIRQNINYIKFVPLFFDFLPIILLCCFRQKIINMPIPYLLLLLNIAYLFNSMIWGQIDSIYTSLIFLALLLAFSYPAWAALLFVLALGTKLQAIIFFPLLAIIFLYSIRSIRQLLVVISTALAGFFLVLAPFIFAGRLPQVWHVVTHAVGFYPRISVGAFNIWYLITPDNPYLTMDHTTYFLLSYQQTGLLLFFTGSFLFLLPLLFRMLSLRLANRPVDDDAKQLIILTAGLVTLCFFYFNTQMHERYAHPVIIFFFFYAVFSKDYKLYILASIAYLLSLDKCFPDYLPIVHYKIIFASKIIALWYTLTIGYGTYVFFKQYNIKKEYYALLKAWSAKKA